MKMKAGFIGLSHLGLIMSTAICRRGAKVVCYGDSDVVSKLKAGKLPIYEPGLDEYIVENGKDQKFTDNLSKLKECDNIFVTEDVECHFDLWKVNKAVEDITSAAKPGVPVVLVSQVPPGFTRDLNDRLPNHPVYYQLDNLVFGRSLDAALGSTKLMIGSYNEKSVKNDAYKKLIELMKRGYVVDSYENVELAKIFVNCFLVSQIAMTNTLAGVCEKVKRSDWHKIAALLKNDPRIGPFAYLSPSIGIGGGHLQRDLFTASKISQESFIDDVLYQCNRRWAHYEMGYTKEDSVAVLGLSYKQNTDSTAASPGIDYVDWLRKFGCKINVHDPVVNINEIGVNQFDDPMECIKDCNILMIATPWHHYQKLKQLEIFDVMKGNKIIFDPHRVLNANVAKANGFQYHTIGKGKS